MAGWIAWQKGLARKAKVFQIAKRLKVTRREAACMCMEVWEWADENTVDGTADGMTPAELSEAVAIPGIAEAMALKEIGWLLVDHRGVIFPDFDRWNGETAKRRLQTAKRVEKHRHLMGQDGLSAKRKRMAGECNA